MGIHDEIILALTQPDENGEVPLYRIVGTKRIEYHLESSTYLPATGQPDYTAPLSPRGITPDIVVEFKDKTRYPIAIEVETDINFNFGRSLRQINKYQRRFEEVKVIIPKEYERFVPLYKNEGFRVYLWETTRIWECMRCGEITDEKRPIRPKCSAKDCNSTEQRLKGIKDTTFKEV